MTNKSRPSNSHKSQFRRLTAGSSHGGTTILRHSSGRDGVAVKETIMGLGVAEHGKMRFEPCSADHIGRIPADQHGFVGDEAVMVVEVIEIGVFSQSAFVDGHLSKVLALILHLLVLEQSVRDAVELGVPQNGHQL